MGAMYPYAMEYYPFVVCFRFGDYEEFDAYFENKDPLRFSVKNEITSDTKDLTLLFSHKYHIVLTYGGNEQQYRHALLSVLPERLLHKWIHIETLTEAKMPIPQLNYIINTRYAELCIAPREQIRPVFSVFTSTFLSYHKILRAYMSLKRQELKDWEWVIVEDSNDNDEHFRYLRTLFKNDCRVRLYRKNANDGFIGNVKNETIGLCRGKYVLEFDHDDEILPFVLREASEYFDAHEDTGFIYMDCVLRYENGVDFLYGNDTAKGYGGYYCQKYGDRWVYVYNTANINNITLSHLTCCPNHPRIWRKSVLDQVGSYCEMLPICDDYEIIVRTCVVSKVAKIHKMGYIQYMNDNSNNFSLIRNSEINRIGPEYLSPQMMEKFQVHEVMKMHDAFEDPKYICHPYSRIWKRGLSYEHKYYNDITNPDYDKQICIIGFDAMIMNMDYIMEEYKNPRTEFMLLENKSTFYYLFNKLEILGFTKFKCYTILDETDDELQNMFIMKNKFCDNVEILRCDIRRPKYNTEHHERHQIMNALLLETTKYLEIGVEHGTTFKNIQLPDTQKHGIDPDPKFESENITREKSEIFFKNLFGTEWNQRGLYACETYDVVFIDGMHQVEFVIPDFVNSCKILSSGGYILFDDVMPMHYEEQLKIPKKYYYENNVLKYTESWTGDVWKAIYYLLLRFGSCVACSFYYHQNYRGVLGMKMLDVEPILNYYNNLDEQAMTDMFATINNYNYYRDFNNYVSLIECLTKQTL